MATCERRIKESLKRFAGSTAPINQEYYLKCSPTPMNCILTKAPQSMFSLSAGRRNMGSANILHSGCILFLKLILWETSSILSGNLGFFVCLNFNKQGKVKYLKL